MPLWCSQPGDLQRLPGAGGDERSFLKDEFGRSYGVHRLGELDPPARDYRLRGSAVGLSLLLGLLGHDDVGVVESRELRVDLTSARRNGRLVGRHGCLERSGKESHDP